MRRANGTRRLGERYLLQFPGGLERLGEVTRAASGQEVLGLLPLGDPLPGRLLTGGIWLLEAGERLVRDWNGAYWSVTWVPAPRPTREAASVPITCVVQFTRFRPGGERIAYAAPSLHRPHELDHTALVGLLRHAWRTLATDLQERRRRAEEHPPALEL